MKTSVLQVRLEPQLKQNTEEIFAQLGINASQAITMFYRQVVLINGIPFELKAPSKETLKVLQDVKEGKNLESVSIEELIAERNR